MAYETLILEHHETVMLIRLNRPESLNAINNKMLTEICTVLKKSSNDTNVRVVMITGSEKFFAAGADIMREKAIKIKASDDTIDIVGTGGDGHNTLNISKSLHAYESSVAD